MYGTEIMYITLLISWPHIAIYSTVTNIVDLLDLLGKHRNILLMK